MPKKPPTPVTPKITRIQVIASTPQAAALATAAQAAGADRSSWMLAHALRAADAQEADGAPVLLHGPIADRLRRAAAAAGTSPERYVELRLLSGAS